MKDVQRKIEILDAITKGLQELRTQINEEVATTGRQNVPADLENFARHVVMAGMAVVHMRKILP